MSVQSTTVYTGTYALRVNPTTVAVANVQYQGLGADGRNSTVSIVTSFFSFYFQYLTKPATNDEEIFRVVAGATLKMSVRLNSAGNLAMYDTSNTIIGSAGATALLSGTWYRIEVQCGTGASTTAEVKLAVGDGASAVELTSATANLSASNTQAFRFGKTVNSNSNTVDFYYADFMWSDAAYPGVQRTGVQLPVGAGTFQTWTIGAGSGSNWQIVNERPPDGDTSYLLSPLITNDAETEACALGSTLGSIGTVNSVKCGCIIKQNVSGGTFKVRMVSNGTTSDNTGTATATANYLPYQRIRDVDPATGAAWTIGALDTLESGALNTSAVNQSRMTWTAIQTNFTPATSLTVSVSDSITLSETATLTLADTVSVTDTITITDADALTLVDRVSTSDSITVTDATTVTWVVNPAVADTVTLTDATALTVAWGVVVSDTVTLAETIKLLLIDFVSVADVLSISDNADMTPGQLFVMVDEPLTVTDAASLKLADFTISVTDPVTVSDVAALTWQANVKTTDAVTVADAAALTQAMSFNVADTITLTETAALQWTTFLSVADLVTLTEAVTFGTAYLVSVSDLVAVADLALLSSEYFLSVAESVIIAETVTVTLAAGAPKPGSEWVPVARRTEWSPVARSNEWTPKGG